MQVVILAGGKGTRLRPFTHTVSKPMILINNKPFLEYLILYLKSIEVKEILILAGYLGHQIKEYFQDGNKFGVKIDYSFEDKLLGTGGALKNAEAKIADEFLLLNGDTYLPMDYSIHMKKFKEYKLLGLVTCYNKDKVSANNIKINSNKMVVEYNKENCKNMTHVDAGVYIFKKKVLESIAENKVCSLEKEIFPKLIKAKQLFAYSTDQKFYDMGTHKGLEDIKDKIASEILL